MIARLAGRVLLLAATTCVLQACGGGGGGSSPPSETKASPSSTASAFDGTRQWAVSTIATDAATVTLPLPPSFYTGGADATLIWATSSGGLMTLKEVKPQAINGWLAVQALAGDLPTSFERAERKVVRAGAWTLMVWSPYGDGTPSKSIYARLVGPGVDSGSVEIAHDLFMVLDLWPMVSADGHAHIYWSDPDDHTSAGRRFHGHFDGPNWIAEAPVEVNYASDKLLVDADGQGWAQGDGLRRLDAATGIGPKQMPDATFAEGYNVTAGQAQPLPDGHLLFTSATTPEPGSSELGCIQAVEVDAKLQAKDKGVCLNLLGSQKSGVGNFRGVSTDSSGRVLMVWSTSAGDHQLYAAVRSPDGQWTSLGKAADFIYNRVAWLFSPQAIIGPDGKLAIVFCSEQGDPAYHPESMTYTLSAVQWDGKKWSAVRTLTLPGASTEAFTAAFDGTGNLGVLSVESKDGAGSIKFWAGNDKTQWADQILQSNLKFNRLTFLGRQYILPDLRLHAVSDGSWAASWVSSSTNGYLVTGATLR